MDSRADSAALVASSCMWSFMQTTECSASDVLSLRLDLVQKMEDLYIMDIEMGHVASESCLAPK